MNDVLGRSVPETVVEDRLGDARVHGRRVEP
jgi:hypothetical protein